MWPRRVWWPAKEHFKFTIPPSSGGNLTILGAISNLGRFYWRCAEKTNKDAVMKFLGSMEDDGVLGGSVIVMDLHRAHLAIIVRELLDQYGVNRLFTPPGCSELNPIERLWSWVKVRWRHRVVENYNVLTADLTWTENQIHEICQEAADTPFLIERLSTAHYGEVTKVLDEAIASEDT